ncbi:hypothetical protein [Brockia lithotrophica]|uniref:Uncharacterized protein n=1 Tax=Brockia lithotrophica TaxID=933949 RepID=A0A660KVJ1_9BACL|nr:hypothetical protein [Brockia lithotrophica]RKQ85416.1 hypothetical protein C7438_0798 [Brockia lithotrophica]
MQGETPQDNRNSKKSALSFLKSNPKLLILSLLILTAVFAGIFALVHHMKASSESAGATPPSQEALIAEVKDYEKHVAENCCLAVKLPVPEGWRVPEHLKEKGPQAVPYKDSATPMTLEYWRDLIGEENWAVANKEIEPENPKLDAPPPPPHPLQIIKRDIFDFAEQEFKDYETKFLTAFERAAQGDVTAMPMIRSDLKQYYEKPYANGYPKSMIDAWKERMSRYKLTFLGYYAYPNEVPESTAELLAVEEKFWAAYSNSDSPLERYFVKPVVSTEEFNQTFKDYKYKYHYPLPSDLSEKKFLFADEAVKHDPRNLLDFYPERFSDGSQNYRPNFILVDYTFGPDGKLTSFTFRPVGTRALYRVDIENPVGSVVKSGTWAASYVVPGDTITFEYADKAHEELLRKLVEYRIPVDIRLMEFPTYFYKSERGNVIDYLETDPHKLTYYYDYKAKYPENIVVTVRGGDFEFGVDVFVHSNEDVKMLFEGKDPVPVPSLLPEYYIPHELDKYHPELRNQLFTSEMVKFYKTFDDRKKWGAGAVPTGGF